MAQWADIPNRGGNAKDAYRDGFHRKSGRGLTDLKCAASCSCGQLKQTKGTKSMERQTERTANLRQAVQSMMQTYKSAADYTAAQMSKNTGVGDGTVKGHLAHNQFNCPNMIHGLLYFDHFGPSMANDFLSLIGMGGARRMERKIVCPFGFHADSSRWAAEQAVALADRVLDHQERAHLAPIALERAEANWQFHRFLTEAH